MTVKTQKNCYQEICLRQNTLQLRDASILAIVLIDWLRGVFETCEHFFTQTSLFQCHMKQVGMFALSPFLLSKRLVWTI